ncbi:hypothetical protein N1851_007171 [Merluccius polli]|uniref:BEN domain-containing protein n=1 Tax=Merluccius polli TaxID=89951 RepID=A0AA47N372_MERPO|nr:hypothetical protein N1851_007171 [Merluccius polli]
MERTFAVVQWIEGVDSGKFSDVKTDAIRNYDDSKMDQDGSPISPYSAFIEWRHGKRRKGGWPHYKGDVLFVSANRFENTSKLNSLLEEVERPQLTKRVSVAPQNIGTIQTIPLILRLSQRKLRPLLALQGSPPSTSGSGPTPDKSPSSRVSTATSASPTPSQTVSQSSKVEIHPGTGVMIDKLAWAYALNSNSATVFVRHLLTAVFPLEILMVSNLRGTNRSGGDPRLPLDKNKLDAIYSATLERFPGTPLSSIGSAVNAKITELRSKSKTSTPHSQTY